MQYCRQGARSAPCSEWRSSWLHFLWKWNVEWPCTLFVCMIKDLQPSISCEEDSQNADSSKAYIPSYKFIKINQYHMDTQVHLNFIWKNRMISSPKIPGWRMIQHGCTWIVLMWRQPIIHYHPLAYHQARLWIHHWMYRLCSLTIYS